MTALSALRAKAISKYPAYELVLDDETVVQLKSVMVLDDEELVQFTNSQKKLTTLDEADDSAGLKAEFVSLLAGVSSDRARTAEALDREGLGVLALILEEYVGSLSEGTKSKDAS